MENTFKKLSRKFMAGLMGMAFVFSILLISVPNTSAAGDGDCKVVVKYTFFPGEPVTEKLEAGPFIGEDVVWAYDYANALNNVVGNNSYTSYNVQNCPKK